MKSVSQSEPQPGTDGVMIHSELLTLISRGKEEFTPDKSVINQDSIFRRGMAMKNICVFCLICVYGIIHWSCGSDAESKDSEKEKVVSVPVEVSRVIIDDVSAFFSGTATLEAEEEAVVVARVPGVVKEILAEEGDRVKRGQILARLDDEQLRFRLNQAQADFNKLSKEHERSEELFRKNLISADAYDKVKFEYEAIKAALDLAQLELNYCAIRAPIDGIIASRFIKTGNMVNTNEQTFKITDFEPLNAMLFIPERHMRKLELRQPVSITVDAVPDNDFTGFVKLISPVIDPQSGTCKVTIEVNDPKNRLKPGMFGRVNIIYDTHHQTLLVPKEAILSEDKESALFVVRDSIALRKVVNCGYVNGTHVEILDGVKEGDTVVTIGQASLKDSSQVDIIGGLTANY